MNIYNIINVSNLPKTNWQIKKASPKIIAIADAYHFLVQDIEKIGRGFDNLWGNGRQKEIVREFSKIYFSNPKLKIICDNSRYFSKLIISQNQFIPL